MARGTQPPLPDGPATEPVPRQSFAAGTHCDGPASAHIQACPLPDEIERELSRAVARALRAAPSSQPLSGGLDFDDDTVITESPAFRSDPIE
jgi:hypothetical protein